MGDNCSSSSSFSKSGGGCDNDNDYNKDELCDEIKILQDGPIPMIGAAGGAFNNTKPIDNPLAIPIEISNLQKSCFSMLDASLYELPNIGVDKFSMETVSHLDYLLLNKYKENENSIREYIKLKTLENDPRILMINRTQFSDLFKINDPDTIEDIFDLFLLNSNQNKNNNNSTSSVNKTAAPDISRTKSNLKMALQKQDKKNQIKKKRLLRKKESSKPIFIDPVGNEKEKIEPQITDLLEATEYKMDNKLKIPMGGGSFPIPVESTFCSNNFLVNQIETDKQQDMKQEEKQENLTLESSINTTDSQEVINSSTTSSSGVSNISSDYSSNESSPVSENQVTIPPKETQTLKPTYLAVPPSFPPTNTIYLNNEKFQSKKKKRKVKKLYINPNAQVNLFDIINQIYLLLSRSGSHEEKIYSCFNLYDIFNKGFITRNDLTEVMKYRIKQNGLTLADFTFESLLDHIFEQFDKNNDGVIDYEEFKLELSKNPESKNKEKVENQVENQHQNQTQLKQKPKETHNVRRYLKIEGTKLIFIFLYAIVNVLLAIYAYLTVVETNRPALLLFGGGLFITRIAAQLIKFNAAFILLTMCKQIFTVIRNTRFKYWFPVDKYLTFHKMIAFVLIAATICHTLGWFIGMAIASSRPDFIFFQCLFPHFITRPTVWQMIFLSLPGLTGFIMLAFIIIIIVCSTKYVRRTRFELFYYSHHLFILFYAMLILHGSLGWVAPATFWKWFIGPAALYAIDRGFRLLKKTHRVDLVEFNLKNEKVVNLKFDKPSSFKYKPGQYLLVNIPEISKLQWHPFTITSSPLEPHIQVHIRVTGGWTRGLFDWLSSKKNTPIDPERGAEQLQINIDGPFGSSSQYALNHKQVILVGAGIGVAPMASLLQDIKLKKEYLAKMNSIPDSPEKDGLGKQEQEVTERIHINMPSLKDIDLGQLEKVHFFWLNRDQLCFQWFEDLLINISRTGHQVPKISINTFNTRCFPKNDVRIFMLWNGLDKLFKSQGLDPTTNLPFKTHWGRPNWDAIFSYYSKKYVGETIGVFCCGPSLLSKELYEKCRYNTSLKSDGTKFYFHKENF
ncbi:hypothetical protein CYY_009035 [Polysphondylium violaceum]|uniref:Superoxide-generating NADPH oxidase flavocytochrome n=1 Tax=Polysphondylium violaceum TaxID=133409 RepID=A0A8J4PMM3_9MYCE|nr:hypothetical protein CYY_009035 [Polysphondylium violaceum]